MVSTRHHPREFPEPATPSSTTPSPAPTSAKAVAKSSTGARGRPAAAAGSWVHTPVAAVVVWLLIAVPVVFWDAGYVLLRPLSMPGGSLHHFWSPYALYGTIDYNYGWPAYNSHQGFPGAQSWLNVVETLAYVYYLVVVYLYGQTATASGRPSAEPQRKGLVWLLAHDKVVPGRIGAVALVVVFATAIATLAKTILYCKNSPGVLFSVSPFPCGRNSRLRFTKLPVADREPQV
jgi:hypothetical protein